VNPYVASGQHKPAQFAAYNAGVRRARRAYNHQQALEDERTQHCECGISFDRPWRLTAHKRAACPLGSS
jgi:CDGSH-type Zn-finger protein